MLLSPLLEKRPEGLFCPPGGFHIDPHRGVERAIITHAHADHARRGSRAYLTSASGAALVRERVGKGPAIETLAWGQPLLINGVRVSLHPAGHLLGSAQVRLEHAGEVAVVTGDFKREPDPTCETFEPVRCDTLVMECTFGVRRYVWPDTAMVFQGIQEWWTRNRNDGKVSVIYAYSLGKAQRLLAGLDASIGPLLAHPAVLRFNLLYTRQGIRLPEVVRATEDEARLHPGALAVVPPMLAHKHWPRRFGPVATALASGWMLGPRPRRQRGIQLGFPLSDHADWPGLVATAVESGARTIWTTHGYTGPFSAHLRSLGLDARPLEEGIGEKDGDEDGQLLLPLDVPA